MGFNRFSLIVVLICILIAVNSIALVIVWNNSDYKVAKLTVSILWVVLILLLIGYVNKTNRSLTQFLENLRYSDYIADSDSGKSFRELNFNFNEIIRYVRLAELEKASTHQYLRQILDQMPSGIITTDKQGKVEIINRSGLDILEIQSVSDMQQLNTLKDNLSKELQELNKTKKKVINLNTKSGYKSVLFKLKEVIINQRLVQIISFENIRTELDLEEEKAWQKIFRVLTHEIMNSIGPIRSLTASVLKLFINNEDTKTLAQLNDEDINIAVAGLKSIDSRNQGLSSFVIDFKKMMRIPEPQLEQVELNQFMYEIVPLLNELCTSKNIQLDFIRSDKIFFVLIDKELISQVMINLVKNSVEAITSNNGIINIKTFLRDDNINISIADNGKGIHKEVLPEIFIPFFTTKKEGSGIGLSISRQILRKHKGDIHVKSEENIGSTFNLKLPVLNY